MSLEQPVVLTKEGSRLEGVARWAYPVDDPPTIRVPALEQCYVVGYWERLGWTIDWESGRIEA